MKRRHKLLVKMLILIEKILSNNGYRMYKENGQMIAENFRALGYDHYSITFNHRLLHNRHRDEFFRDIYRL